MARDHDELPPVTFGELIRYLRLQRGIGLRELGRLAGVSLSHIQYIEQDVRTPQRKTILKLARALSVSAGWLMSEQRRRVSAAVLIKQGLSRELAYWLCWLAPLSAADEARLIALCQELAGNQPD